MEPTPRSPLVVLVLVLSLCFSLAFASYAGRDVEEAGRRRGEGEGDEGRSAGRPYHFGEESFRHWTRTRHGRFRVLERFADELLEGVVGDYRVAVLEAAPRAFLQPSHYDADEIFYVKEGEGVLVLLWKGRRESFCVREGDVMVIPAGAIVYSANTHDSKWLRVVMVLKPVSTPGRFEEYFPVGGERPESFFSVFSDDVLQAAFNTRREEWEKVFESQRKGEITVAPEEQIRELSKSCSRGGGGGGGGSGSEWEIKPSSLTSKWPCYSNNHGRLSEITGDECPHLRKLDMEVGLANITSGSMMAPSYSTRATKIAVVLEGSGFFEMACPHLSGRSERREREREHGRRDERGREEQGHEQQEEEEDEEHGGQKSRSYRQVRAHIREGSVIVLPAAHPTTLVSGNNGNLAVLCFAVRANHDEKVFLAGRNSVLRQLDEPAKALAFGAPAREVDRIIGAQPEAVFLRGPQRRGVSDM